MFDALSVFNRSFTVARRAPAVCDASTPTEPQTSWPNWSSVTGGTSPEPSLRTVSNAARLRRRAARRDLGHARARGRAPRPTAPRAGPETTADGCTSPASGRWPRSTTPSPSCGPPRAGSSTTGSSTTPVAWWPRSVNYAILRLRGTCCVVGTWCSPRTPTTVGRRLPESGAAAALPVMDGWRPHGGAAHGSIERSSSPSTRPVGCRRSWRRCAATRTSFQGRLDDACRPVPYGSDAAGTDEGARSHRLEAHDPRPSATPVDTGPPTVRRARQIGDAVDRLLAVYLSALCRRGGSVLRRRSRSGEAPGRARRSSWRSVTHVVLRPRGVAGASHGLDRGTRR